MVLTVDLPLLTLLGLTCRCLRSSTSRAIVILLSFRFRTSTGFGCTAHFRATVLVLHWIRFLFLVKGSGRCCLLCLHYNINCVICQDLLRCFSKISPTISLAFSSLFWWYISIPPVGLVTFNNLILGMYANVNPLVVTILVPLIILFSLSF